MPNPNEQTQESQAQQPTTPPSTEPQQPQTGETPPETPAVGQQAETPAEPPASDSEIDWGALLGPDDGDEDEPAPAAEPQEPQEPPAVQPEAQPTQPPAQPQEPAQPPPQQPQPEPVPQPQAQPQPQPEPQPTQTPAQQWDQWKTAAEDHYAKSVFGMTEDEGVELIRAPHEQLPRMAAKVAVLAQEAIYNNLAAVLPGMIEQTIDRVRGEGRTEKALLEAYPQLKGRRDTYTKVLQGLRGMYPDMDAKKLVDLTGRTAYDVLGLKADPAPGGNGQQQPQQPQQPAQPGVRQSVEPFNPAAPGAGGPPAKKKGPANVWSDLDAQWNKEETESEI